MRITLFTSNKNRHNYLINLLAEVSDELYVIQECGTIFPGIISGNYQASPAMKNILKMLIMLNLNYLAMRMLTIKRRILKFCQLFLEI